MKRLKPSVLAVDDDVMFRKVLEAVLGRLGMIVKTTANEKEFMSGFNRIRPDLCLIDLQLGGQSGFDLIKKIREIDAAVSVVVISGSEEESAVAHALEAGANDFILKPLDKTLLASKLSRFINTEELIEHTAEFVSPPQGNTEVLLHLEATIEAIDELGVTCIGKSLIPKGTVLKLSSGIFQEIGLEAQEVLVSITNTWYDAKSNAYGAYAEFDGVDLEFLQRIRAWLGQKCSRSS